MMRSCPAPALPAGEGTGMGSVCADSRSLRTCRKCLLGSASSAAWDWRHEDGGDHAPSDAGGLRVPSPEWQGLTCRELALDSRFRSELRSVTMNSYRIR